MLLSFPTLAGGPESPRTVWRPCYLFFSIHDDHPSIPLSLPLSPCPSVPLTLPPAGDVSVPWMGTPPSHLLAVVLYPMPAFAPIVHCPTWQAVCALFFYFLFFCRLGWEGGRVLVSSSKVKIPRGHGRYGSSLSLSLALYYYSFFFSSKINKILWLGTRSSVGILGKGASEEDWALMAIHE